MALPQDASPNASGAASGATADPHSPEALVQGLGDARQIQRERSRVQLEITLKKSGELRAIDMVNKQPCTAVGSASGSGMHPHRTRPEHG